ncbi:MAG: SLATT domain-containing protein [Pseudomonadales bacterium]|nr:SLATT domain-containing protein [Pseudomonadales bacterium]
MVDKSKIVDAVIAETYRIEEDALHSMKGHFNAGSLWSKAHLLLGLPSAVLAAWAGIEAFSDNPEMTAILALLAAALTSTMTFLSPQQVADNHKNSGREYNILKNRVRRFREIDLLQLEDDAITKTITELAGKRDALNSMSPDIPRWAYEKAKKDIDAGRADYNIDKEVSDDSK